MKCLKHENLNASNMDRWVDILINSYSHYIDYNDNEIEIIKNNINT